MRLRTITPALPHTLVTDLENCGIRTDTDLLFNYGTAMQIYEKLPQETITLAELEQCINAVAALVSSPWMDSEDLLAQEESQHATFEPFSTGIPQLDSIINGPNGPKVLEVSGDRGTGKSLLALQLVMRQLCTHADHAALWIDTTGDFSVDSVHPVIAALNSLPATHSAAERLQLSLAFDANGVQGIIDMLETSYTLPGQTTKVRCLVIDSITPIFRPLLSIVSSQGHAMMISFMQRLKSLAETHSLTVLILNSTSSAVPQSHQSWRSTTARKPALGPSFTYMTDATLWLSRSSAASTEEENDTQKSSIHTAEILRSRNTLSKTRCCFRIENGLLREA